MKVFVTGGAGVVGSNFIAYMMDTHPDYRVCCVDKLTYAGNLSSLQSVMGKPESLITCEPDRQGHDRYYAVDL